MAKTRDELSAIDKLILRAQAEEESIGGDEDIAKTTWPQLWIWLTRTAVGKNLIKEPAKLAIKAIPGGFFATVSDASLKSAVDATSESLGGIFDSLEAELSRLNPVIRPYGKGEVRLKKRRKGD